MEEAQAITFRRRVLWDEYHRLFADLEKAGTVRRPVIPEGCRHNAHMYYLLTGDLRQRTEIIARLKALEICAVFHYVPLHSSPAGRKYGRTHGILPVTDSISERVVRLPLWVGMDEMEKSVCETVAASIRG